MGSTLPGGRLFGAALAAGAFFFGTYTVFEVTRIRNLPYPDASALEIALQKDHSKAFDNLAQEYDGEVNSTEFWSGMKLMRKRLVGHAQGNVLEVAAGTARNIPYYKVDALKSLTLTDSSAQMLEVAKTKWEDRVKSEPGLRRTLPAYFHAVDAHKLPAPDGTFDTVVSTFGVCSCSDPVKELKELARVCKPDGQILLLEHGRATWDTINELLDKRASRHAERWGCWWNRDVLKVVNDAGLEVEYAKRWHFGTTYYLICRPKKAESQ